MSRPRVESQIVLVAAVLLVVIGSAGLMPVLIAGVLIAAGLVMVWSDG